MKPGETVACVSGILAPAANTSKLHSPQPTRSTATSTKCAWDSIPSWTKVGVPTIGKCKGTLEAMKAADIIVIFHVPLFTSGSRK